MNHTHLKFTNIQAEMLYHEIKEKYNTFALNKKQQAEVRNCSIAKINYEVANNLGVPYIKEGTAKNATVRFNIIDVAEYLSNTIKTA